MALSLVTNTSSINAQRNLMGTQRRLNRSISRLSSGLRINRAADDAAGLAISENLKAQIRSARQAERNANDGISLIQTAEGSMNEIQGILQRMRELAMEAATDTIGDQERQYLDKEYSELKLEIDRISNTTEFNGTKLLNGDMAASGSTPGAEFQVGIGNTTDDRIGLSIAKMDTTSLAADATATGGSTAPKNLGETKLYDTDGTGSSLGADPARAALAAIDQALDDVSSARSELGAKQNRLEITVSNLANFRENLAAANSRIRDTDVAEETAAMTRSSILMQSGIAVLAQANQLPSMALSLLG